MSDWDSQKSDVDEELMVGNLGSDLEQGSDKDEEDLPPELPYNEPESM